MTTDDPRRELAEAARLFYARGWMYGTAGNLSARTDDGSLWITASGRPKGLLQETDFVRVAPDGTVLQRGQPEFRPSAETSIHHVIYRQYPAARACYHVHTIEANLVANWAVDGQLRLPPLEMIKGFDIWEENPQVDLLVLPNHGQVPRIAADLDAEIARVRPQLPAFLIGYHGLTVWGPTQMAARNYLELLDYIFRYMVAARLVAGTSESRAC